ncbi:hypothetical protein [Pseudomonas monteilii]|uniref:hypothetical protein n=1 Tax=Pseudomonas monteilii TaxID=76759 RepID=UPI0025A68ADC|nr:hypothetical protein [Pseudomonas monteilii]WJO32077.1 hypothetical protein LU690_23875 [Pseudomonas monteilii]
MSAAKSFKKIFTRKRLQEIYTDRIKNSGAIGLDRMRPASLRIPRHPATQSALIWPGIPGPSGHLFHGHPAGQSERSDAGVALLVRVGWRRQFLRPFAH